MEKIMSRPVYTGPRFTVHNGQFAKHDGAVVTREWVDPGDVVAVLAVQGDFFYMGSQPREVIQTYQLGLCAGQIDPGEDAETAARRELLEEFGFSAGEMKPVDWFYSSGGFTTEFCHLFVARDLTKDTSKLDAEEDITVLRYHVSAAATVAAVTTDAKAKIALLLLAAGLI